jgi:signal transduction histidine kinase
MNQGPDIVFFLIAGLLLAVLTLALIIFYMMKKSRQLTLDADTLRKSLDEMDEQAKLIVRTDMELNKTQEELDKKVSGLYALQRFSRAVSTTLEEDQIFSRIETSFLEELGFEKALIFMLREEGSFRNRLNISYSEDELKVIQSFLDSNRDFYAGIIRDEKPISSLADIPFAKEQNNRVLKVNSFVISPVSPREGTKGFLFVGTENTDTVITEGDEELITILAAQLGQALENARLFEKTWGAQQELERKVEERTHELKKLLDEVKKISKRKTDFVSSVSHELRTPLTSIKGYAAILLAGQLGNIPQEVKERLEKINRHSDELVHMVNDLLDISRIEAGRVTMKQEPQDLQEIAEKAVDLLTVQAKEKRIELTYTIDPASRRVMADRNQIERVFINLVGNAMKFTPANGRIIIRAHAAQGAAQVDITDTGCGIPTEAQESIFEEFYRVDNAINQEVKGTGLGLALVKHIVEAHGGKIWVKSKPGSGSTFTFTLPLIIDGS